MDLLGRESGALRRRSSPIDRDARVATVAASQEGIIGRELLRQDHGLVAELDSGHHDAPRARAAEAALRASGFAVVRFRRCEMRAGGDALANRLRRILTP